MHRRSITVTLLIIILLLPYNKVKAATLLHEYSVKDNANYTRISLNLDSSPKYKIFTLSSPPRIVIDLFNTSVPHELSNHSDKLIINGMRYSSTNAHDLRVVFEPNNNIKIKKTSLVELNKEKKSLIIDIVTTSKYKNISIATPHPIPHLKQRPKPIVIIDAGHGGHDPGAKGKSAKEEKFITLSYAKALKKALTENYAYDVYMTRDQDNYVDLKERVKISEDKKADLFISLHADSHNDKSIQGLSVYTLSETASDKEAAALAENANSSGIIGTVKIETKTSEITPLLVDMVQREKKNQSATFAEILVKQLQAQVSLLPNTHRFAGFKVLTSPSVPSVLIELGYLSNDNEQKLLATSAYRKKMISAINKAIEIYFQNYAKE